MAGGSACISFVLYCLASRTLDDGRDDDDGEFIVPGLGDYGDRYYGTSGYAEGHWGTDGK